MTRILSVLICGALACFVASGALAQTQTQTQGQTQTNTSAQTPPKTTLKASHGDWQVMCDQGQSSGPGCFMVQSVDVQQTGKRILVAAILKAKDGKPVLRFTVPLGVLLPKGLSLAVDGKDMGEVNYVACFPEGCMTQVQLATKVLDAMEKGKKATVTIFGMDSKPAHLPVSLTGFTAAFNDF